MTRPRHKRVATSARTDTRPVAVAVLAIVVLSVFVYSPLGHAQFVGLDDPDYVLNNPHVTTGLTWGGIGWALTASHAANWHPLTWMSHMLDVQLFGVSPGAHHLMNVTLHTLSAVLLLLALWRMTGRIGRSAVVAALFAVHPLHVESVAWISERKDVLSAFFLMLVLVAYASYVRRPTTGRYASVLLLFGCGLAAKPMLVTVPFVLLLLDVWPLGRLGSAADSRTAIGRLMREKIPLFALSALSCALTYWAQHRAEAVRNLDVVPFAMRVVNAIHAYGAYIWKAIWPAHLAVFYPYPRAFVAWQIALAAFALGVMSWFALRQVRRAPYLLVGWLWFLGMLVPVIGLVQVGEQSMADRYTYLPLIGLFIAVTWGVADLVTSRAIAIAAAAVGVVACAFVARTQAATWTTNEELWQHAVDVTADNYLAESALGDALADRGVTDAAIAHHRNALRIKPDHADAHNDLGRVLAETGRLDEALGEFGEAVRLRPNWAEAHHNLGAAFASRDRPAEAIEQFKQALRLDPDLDRTHRALGIQLQKLNRDSEALEEFLHVVRLTPLDPAAHFNLALMYLRMRNTGEAAKALTRVLELDPSNAAARQLLDEIRRSRGGDEAV